MNSDWDDEDIKEAIKNSLEKFNVNFSKSNVKVDSCKVYFVESDTKNFEIKNCLNKAYFKKIN